jgi:hypothetical protein
MGIIFECRNKLECLSLEAPFMYPTLLALLTNIRQGWRGLPGTNTLAYYKHSYYMAVKIYIALEPSP